MTAASSFGTTVRNGAETYGITLGDEAITRLENYFEILTAYNLRTNLVSKGDMERFAEYHILDSLKIASCIDLSGVRRAMDFGSGAGLPGIPLAVVFPGMEMYCVDSRTKRCAFLSAAVSDIPLQNVRVLRSRAESLPADYNRFFNCIVTRATVSLESFFRIAWRFSAPHGILVAIKGDDIGDEIQSLKNAADLSLFNIEISRPAPVENVRTGHIVTISA